MSVPSQDFDRKILKHCRSKGLVEIYWRGQVDSHCTMQSISESMATRFGTSIQLTKKGVNACDKFWDRGGATSRVVTMFQRANKKSKPGKKKGSASSRA